MLTKILLHLSKTFTAPASKEGESKKEPPCQPSQLMHALQSLPPSMVSAPLLRSPSVKCGWPREERRLLYRWASRAWLNICLLHVRGYLQNLLHASAVGSLTILRGPTSVKSWVVRRSKPGRSGRSHCRRYRVRQDGRHSILLLHGDSGRSLVKSLQGTFGSL